MNKIYQNKTVTYLQTSEEKLLIYFVKIIKKSKINTLLESFICQLYNSQIHELHK